MTPKELTEERHKQHGSWHAQAFMAQLLKNNCRAQEGWLALPPQQREAIEMALVKISRIVHGDENHLDHWDDIQSYVELGKPEALALSKEPPVAKISDAKVNPTNQGITLPSEIEIEEELTKAVKGAITK